MIIITHRPNSISNHHHPILSVGAHVRTRTRPAPPRWNSTLFHVAHSLPYWLAEPAEGGTALSRRHIIITDGSRKVHRRPQSGYSFSARSVHLSPIPSFPLHPSGLTSPPPPLFVPRTLSVPSFLPFILHPSSFIFLSLFSRCPPHRLFPPLPFPPFLPFLFSCLLISSPSLSRAPSIAIK